MQSFPKASADDKRQRGLAGAAALPADARCSFPSETLRRLQTESQTERRRSVCGGDVMRGREQEEAQM